jgi:phenylacetate-CoA ligase
MALRNRFWEPKLERLNRKDLKQLQSRRLRNLVKYVYENSRFYRSALKKVNVDPSSIRGIDDLGKLPFTTKEDLRDNYPLGMLSTSNRNLSRVHTSSGTTGNPTVVAYTRNDLENWWNTLARCLTMTGVTREDIFQTILGYGLFTGGLGFHYGAEKIGATVVPSSTGNTKRQVKLMKDFNVTAFTSIPSYTIHLAEVAEKQGIDLEEDLKIRTISCGAESWSERAREKIQKMFGCMAFNSYGLSEVGGPGVAFECLEQNGLHIWADHFIAEIVDPETGESLPSGEQGELVLTTLTREAMPLIRYRTRDLTAFIENGECECGRTHPRISWFSGRTDDMLKIRGVNVFPTQIECVLMGHKEVGNNYQLILSQKEHMDVLTVNVETAQRSTDKQYTSRLESKLQEELASTLSIKVKVEVVKPGTINRTEGKAKRILDMRDSR